MLGHGGSERLLYFIPSVQKKRMCVHASGTVFGYSLKFTFAFYSLTSLHTFSLTATVREDAVYS